MNKSLQESYGTLSETVNALTREGYTLNLNMQEDCLVCNQHNLSLSPEDFKIDKIYRFEGPSNPDDQAIVYAISSPRFAVKGVLVNGYGPSADSASSAMVAKLNTHPDKNSDQTP